MRRVERLFARVGLIAAALAFLAALLVVDIGLTPGTWPS
jgi:hypothetical protein